MDTKVKEFLDAAKAKEREAFEKKRDEHLISLGLVNEEESVREYADNYNYVFNKWDEEAKKYYREKLVAISVTDEEYEEIIKHSTPTANDVVELDNGAEKFLGVINIIALIVSIITTIVLAIIASSEGEGVILLAGLGVLLVGLISWAVVKVMLNISNNLHKINSKLK